MIFHHLLWSNVVPVPAHFVHLKPVHYKLKIRIIVGQIPSSYEEKLRNITKVLRFLLWFLISCWTAKLILFAFLTDC
jgi:hypothetical protein